MDKAAQEKELSIADVKTEEVSSLIANMDLKRVDSSECDSSDKNDVSNNFYRVSSNERPQKSSEGISNGITPDTESKTSNESGKRISKAQKRRNRKAEMTKKRDEAIAEQEIHNLSGVRNIESEKIKLQLQERNLSLYEVNSDGDCLYKSIEHQLSLLGDKKLTVSELRQLTSDYMLRHADDFIPFILNPVTGDILNEEEYVKYCNDIAMTPAWGGHVEIQALSHICGKTIEVIQADGPSVLAGMGEPRLILTYHRHAYGLGEHYNSVVPIVEQDA